jgi:hypothetical protein
MRVEDGLVRPQNPLANQPFLATARPEAKAADGTRTPNRTTPDLLRFKLHRLDERLSALPQFTEALAWSRAKLGLDNPKPTQAVPPPPQFGRSRSNSLPHSASRPNNDAPARQESQQNKPVQAPKHAV